ncbi:MAG: hypothetical protein EBZ60_03805 [Betaproteobacteria bacterium]|nr:hypothetical protein [Betaproteobacteria bacterium]
MPNQPTNNRKPQALGLTVYDLPDPVQAADEDARRTLGGRWRMMLVMLICAAPVIASYLAFYVIRPGSFNSFGTLIQPVKALPAVQVTNLQGGQVFLPSLKDQWLLISVAPAACDAACQQNLYLQRQIRAALGREKDRTDWVWLISDDAPVDDTLQAALSEAVVLRMPLAQIEQWLLPQAGHALADHLYLVDPHGDWMMRFPANLTTAQAPKLRQDWERLLRASVSWDKPGRSNTP